jgi:hypothetical protein
MKSVTSKSENNKTCEQYTVGHLVNINEIGDDVFFETDLGLVFVAQGSSENPDAPYVVSAEGTIGKTHFKTRDGKGGMFEVDEGSESYFLGFFEKTSHEELWRNIAKDFNESFARHLNVRINV